MIEGEAAMIRTAKENPSAFTAICARLLPAEASITLERVTPQGLDPEDLAILKAIKAAIPDANDRSPEDVLTHVLQAVRAHSSHQIIDARDNESRGRWFETNRARHKIKGLAGSCFPKTPSGKRRGNISV
jgi:hypothetical protein